MHRYLIGFGLLALATAASARVTGVQASGHRVDGLTGDYVESRSLSIFAGACHYGGEAVTAGRQAILAWRIDRGQAAGQSLDGLTAVAVVNGPANLALDPSGHRTLLYVDQSATLQQRTALVTALRHRYLRILGDVAVVQPASISFTRTNTGVHVQVAGSVDLAVDRFPCSHCVMPHEVWYAPFVPLSGGQVARALHTQFRGEAAGFTQWSAGERPSAYLGRFAL